MNLNCMREDELERLNCTFLNKLKIKLKLIRNFGVILTIPKIKNEAITNCVYIFRYLQTSSFYEETSACKL